ncbi:MAG TPA: MFS transporter [Burkholderiaceae bacterium]|nr:MFS transporter [Burkholderiaceae bacterium]
MSTTLSTTEAGKYRPARGASKLYMWSVFALTFGLMLSDYLTRNVISAVFPLLKAEWSLTDAQLGALVSVVALVVGVASIPIALLADRWGRVKSITVMAALWCFATIGCGLTQNHAQLLVTRGLVGLGEAGYGAAGGAILANVFPPERRSMVLGAFLAASLFGSVLGVAVGGALSVQFGWRTAFIAVGAASLLLVVLYPLVVRDYETVPLTQEESDLDGARAASAGLRGILRELFRFRTVVLAYCGSGLQMFILGALMAWLPSFFARGYGLPPDKAGLQAAGVVAVLGVGMIIGGALADRMGRKDPRNKLRMPALYALITFVLLTAAFALPPGPTQLGFLYAGVFLAGGHSGASSAAVMDVVHPGLIATAAATVVLFNNLLGLAPGPWAVGQLSDAFGLQTALMIAPLVSLAAAACFVLAARAYPRDCLHYAALRARMQPGLSPLVH